MDRNLEDEIIAKSRAARPSFLAAAGLVKDFPSLMQRARDEVARRRVEEKLITNLIIKDPAIERWARDAATRHLSRLSAVEPERESIIATALWGADKAAELKATWPAVVEQVAAVVDARAAAKEAQAEADAAEEGLLELRLRHARERAVEAEIEERERRDAAQEERERAEAAEEIDEIINRSLMEMHEGYNNGRKKGGSWVDRQQRIREKRSKKRSERRRTLRKL